MKASKLSAGDCPACGSEYKGQEVEVLGPSEKDKTKTVLKTKCLGCGHSYYFVVEKGEK